MILLKQVDRLVGSSVLVAVAAAWALLVGLDALFILMGQLGQVGKGNYTLATAFAYVGWTVPRRAVEMFGSAAAIGAVMGLGALAPTSELTALRAGGLSKFRIAAGGALGIVVLLAGVLVLAETLAPFGEARAQAISAGAKSRDLIAAGKTGLWVREGDSFINARGGTLDPQGVTLTDLRIFEFKDNGELARVSIAKQARHAERAWTLSGIARFRFDGDAIAREQEERVAWDTRLDPRLISTSIINPAYLSLADLSRSIEYLVRNQLDAAPYEAALWARIFYPLDVLALAFAALPFAFGALRSGGYGKRLFLGVMLAVGWYFFQRGAVNVAVVYGVDFRLAHALPIVLLGAGAWSYFRRTA